MGWSNRWLKQIKSGKDKDNSKQHSKKHEHTQSLATAKSSVFCWESSNAHFDVWWHHRIIYVGRDVLRSSSPSPLVQAISDRAGCTGHVQSGCSISWQTLHNLSGYPIPVFDHPNFFVCVCSGGISCIKLYLLSCQQSLLRKVRLPLLYSLPSDIYTYW